MNDTPPVAVRLAIKLERESGFTWEAAERIGAEWAALAELRRWPYALVEQAMCECAALGISAAGFARATEPPIGPRPLKRIGVSLRQPVPVKGPSRRRRR